MQPGILIVEGLQQGLLIPLDHEVTTIGRDVKCSVQIDDATISRVHCRIYRRQVIPGEISYVLEDAGSFNGTLLNGVAVERAEISHGDQLSIGKTHLRFDEFSQAVGHRVFGFKFGRRPRNRSPIRHQRNR